MATFKPYTYIQCPCSEVFDTQREDETKTTSENENSDEEKTFDPRAPRSNYSLYPLEHLLYCEDCRQIRCPRCVLDEIVTYYCPNCLFEVPSSTVKSEGNRCTRSCFQCPICTSPLTVSSLEPPPEGLAAENVTPYGPFVLNCGYCLWTTKEIGIQFERQNGIYWQMFKSKNDSSSTLISSPKERRRIWDNRQRDFLGTSITLTEDDPSPVEESSNSKLNTTTTTKLDAENQFSHLKAFYQSQLPESFPMGSLSLAGEYGGHRSPSYGSPGYGSPGTLARIMGLYTSRSLPDDLSSSKSNIMREACNTNEGLQIFDSTEMMTADQDIINRLRSEGWQNTTTCAQRRNATNANKRFLSELWPTAFVLRTKRSKRCRTCRQILSKPEAKIQSTRFRIRLIALNFIPSLSIQSLHTPSLLTPMKPVQFLLTCRNPLFDKIKVTLATPSKTSGRNCSKTTVLCPEFEVGANTDVWDEALRVESTSKNGMGEKRRTKNEQTEGQNQAEAGKVWERGRNWVSVVLEVVPSDYRLDEKESKEEREKGEKITENKNSKDQEQNLWSEDEDICEIPVFVRVEWETDPVQDEGGSNISTSLSKTGGEEKEAILKETRELAYWCVLGVGRIGKI